MHVEADLLDGIGDVGAGERQVLEGPGETPKVSWVSNRRPRLGRDLGMRVHWRQNWLAVHHTSSLKNIESKLTLSEEESASLMLYGDPQEMMEGPEILHGEFLLEGRHGLLQKCCTESGEDNVINIKQQVYHICAALEDEEGGVVLGLNKSQGGDLCGEPAIPSPGRLLQPVQRLVEEADAIGLRRINNPVGCLQ
jgi:hypothetical protein